MKGIIYNNNNNTTTTTTTATTTTTTSNNNTNINDLSFPLPLEWQIVRKSLSV